MSQPNTFASAEAFKTFALAGRATFTVRSHKTGQHFTFDLGKSDVTNMFFAHVHTGGEPAYVGFVLKNELYRGVIKGKKGLDERNPCSVALSWVLRELHKGVLPACATIQHEGRCGVCHRPLTNPASIASGIGPECAAKVGLRCTVEGARMAA